LDHRSGWQMSVRVHAHTALLLPRYIRAHQEKIELPYEETKYSTPARSTHLAL